VKKKILIVEDNNDSRAILVLMLTKMGYQTIEAQNSKEAIACAEAEQPTLIFMDMGLPDSDGIKTSAILKKNQKNLSHSYRRAHGMDVRTMAGKSFEIGH
jgi:CheY-like chemotaxis protein